MWVHAVRYGGSALLLSAALGFVVLSRHWPVVNDAALMHYVVLLQQYGEAPYRAIRDINFPGAYLPDRIAMKMSATGWISDDVAWRVYDVGLLALAGAAMVVITLPYDWFAGLFGGVLFALFHGRDGVGQAGQRDLAMAVLFLLALAALLVALRRLEVGQADAHNRTVEPTAMAPSTRGPSRSLSALFAASGLALGAATTIKPFGLIYLIALLPWVLVALKRIRPRDRSCIWPALAAATAGFALPLAAAAAFLLRQHALGSFLSVCRVSLPYHASVGRWPWLGMLQLAAPSSFLKLGAIALILGLVRQSWRRLETQVLWLGLLLGLGCFLVQDKGYSYQRYPYIIFLLPWVGLECTAALRDRRLLLRALGSAGLLFGIFGCAPSYLRAAYHAAWPEPYLLEMERDLRGVAGSRRVAGLNGRVQCLDSISGCATVLYRLRLEQSTGTIYDEFLFAPPRLAGQLPEAVAAERESFLRELAAHPPEVLLMAAWLFPEGPGEYGKLALWPAFREYLAEHYQLADEQVFPRSENGPLGFRMYVRR